MSNNNSANALKWDWDSVLQRQNQYTHFEEVMEEEEAAFSGGQDEFQLMPSVSQTQESDSDRSLIFLKNKLRYSETDTGSGYEGDCDNAGSVLPDTKRNKYRKYKVRNNQHEASDSDAESFNGRNYLRDCTNTLRNLDLAPSPGLRNRGLRSMPGQTRTPILRSGGSTPLPSNPLAFPEQHVIGSGSQYLRLSHDMLPSNQFVVAPYNAGAYHVPDYNNDTLNVIDHEANTCFPVTTPENPGYIRHVGGVNRFSLNDGAGPPFPGAGDFYDSSSTASNNEIIPGPNKPSRLNWNFFTRPPPRPLFGQQFYPRLRASGRSRGRFVSTRGSCSCGRHHF